MSLKQKILYWLEKNGRISLLELDNLCKSEHYKLSNAERRLRELMSPKSKDYNSKVKPEKNSAGAIIAYRWSTETLMPDLTKLTPKAQAFLNQWKKEEVKTNQTLF